jgi:hypothetical protein
MKKSIVRYFLYIPGIYLALVVTSCAPAYVPNTIHSPMLSNKGEFHASINEGLSGFDPQLAFAITDHLGIMANGSFADRTSDSTDSFHKHSFVEAGAGYYRKLGVAGRLEAYGGGGFGKLRAFQDAGLWTSYADVKSMRFFVQPAIGVATDIFDGSLAARVVAVNLKQDSLNNTGFFFEPAITAKVGYKWVKAVFQFGLSVPLGSENIDFSYEPFIFSIGLQATIGKR